MLLKLAYRKLQKLLFSDLKRPKHGAHALGSTLYFQSSSCIEHDRALAKVCANAGTFVASTHELQRDVTTQRTRCSRKESSLSDAYCLKDELSGSTSASLGAKWTGTSHCAHAVFFAFDACAMQVLVTPLQSQRTRQMCLCSARKRPNNTF